MIPGRRVGREPTGCRPARRWRPARPAHRPWRRRRRRRAPGPPSGAAPPCCGAAPAATSALAGRAWRPCSAGRPRTAPDRQARAPRCAPPPRPGWAGSRAASCRDRRDRVQQAEVGAAAAEALGLLAAAGTTRSPPRSGRARPAPGAPAARGAAGRRAPAWRWPRARGSDVVGMRSKPWTRITSSTRSASPSMSGRQDGTAAVHGAAAVDGEAELAQDAPRSPAPARRSPSASSPGRRASV